MWQLSRRALFRAAASVGLSGVAAKMSLGCTDDDPVAAGPRPIERTTLELSLDNVPAGLPDLRFDLGDARYPVLQHDAVSLRAARGRNPLLAGIPDEQLTHYVADIALPADAPQSYSVSYAIPGSELRCLALAGIHVPKAAVTQAQALKGASYSYLGFRRAQFGFSTRSVTGGLHILDCVQGAATGDITDLAEFTDEYDAARYLVYHHSDILSLDAKVAATLFPHVDCAEGLPELAQAIAAAGETQPVGSDGAGVTAWARGEYTLDPNGQRTQQEDADGKKLTGPDGKPIYEWHYAIDEGVLAALQTVVTGALKRIHDDADLTITSLRVTKRHRHGRSMSYGHGPAVSAALEEWAARERPPPAGGVTSARAASRA